MKIIFVFLSILYWISIGYSQYTAGHIPVSYRQEWNKAGLIKKDIPNSVERIINFKTEFNATEGNDEKIVQILNDLSGNEFTIIYFPEGEYFFYKPIIINKDNVVLLGDGSDKTKLFFENAKTDPCILIVGSGFSTKYDINGPVFKGNTIVTADAIPYMNDQWVYFHEQKSGYGQITKISTYGAIPIPDLLELKDKTTRDYKTNDLQIALFEPRKNVGIENLMVKKNTRGKGNDGNSIYFIRAVNCWVKGVESAYSSQHHIAMVNCSHIEVSGNYLHHARYYGQGGFGYGVTVHHNSTNCLVENNILKHLRHSIALQKGANCNVIAYNYSYDRRSFNDDIFSPENQSCDLVLHGNYTWGNLLEHNNVAAIAADNTHGENGPFNAFVRNKSRADGIIAFQPGWYPLEYGLVLYKAPYTSLLGNVISNNDVEYAASDLAVNIFGRAAAEGDYDDWSDIGHRGSTYRNAKDKPNSYFMYDASYYYTERPAFLPEEYTYPSIGPKPMSGIELTQNIPAHGRVKDNLIPTVNINPTASPTILTLITKTDVSVDTTVHQILNVQPLSIADSLIHPLSAEKYFFAGFENNELLNFNTETREIVPGLTSDNTYTVLYKRALRSSNENAYKDNGKRKFIKDQKGSLYNIYESMGHIFLEHKMKSGIWKIISDNPEKLFLDTHGAHAPAIDYAKQDDIYTNLVGMTYQEGNNIHLKTVYKENEAVIWGPQLELLDNEIERAIDMRANIAWGGKGVFFILWEDSVSNPGINYRLCKLTNSFAVIDSGVLKGTGENSRNVAVSAWFDDSTDINYFDFVWEQHLPEAGNSLTHIRAIHGADGITNFSEPRQISKNNFEINTDVAMVSLPQGAIACWLVGYDSGIYSFLPRLTALRNVSTMGNLYLYSGNPITTAINKFNDNSGYYFGWSDYSYRYSEWFNNLVYSDDLSIIRTDLPVNGNEFQLSNSNNLNDIDIMGFYHDKSPYSFQSNEIGSNFNKAHPYITKESKGFTLSKNGTDFDYLIGDLNIDDERIAFNDKLSDESRDIIYSDNFHLFEHSKIKFDESIGVFDSTANAKLLNKTDYISIKVELVDEADNELQTIKKLNITKENLAFYRTKSVQFNNNDFSASVRIKITLDTDIKNININQLNYYFDQKADIENQSIEEINVVNDFALKQNYPNPFNPVTKIAYQIAKKVKVSIKIYDILGREVVTLVNEEKDQGKYTIDFDAAELSGGLYLYKMHAGAFSKTKKMILIK